LEIAREEWIPHWQDINVSDKGDIELTSNAVWDRFKRLTEYCALSIKQLKYSSDYSDFHSFVRNGKYDNLQWSMINDIHVSQKRNINQGIGQTQVHGYNRGSMGEKR
jgi:hypothetical protein